jgi:hypothetical protein
MHKKTLQVDWKVFIRLCLSESRKQPSENNTDFLSDRIRVTRLSSEAVRQANRYTPVPCDVRRQRG